MSSVKVTFLPEGTMTKAKSGQKILDIASHAAIDINNLCGGQGVCGRCRVKILRGQVSFSSKHIGFLDMKEIEAGFVLACQTEMLEEDVEVWIPQESRIEEEQILTQYDTPLVLDKYSRPPATPGEGAPGLGHILRYEEPASIEKGPDFPSISASYFKPLSQKFYLQLPKPSLTDSLSDLDRIYRELRKVAPELQTVAHFSCLWGLATMLRQNDWKITVTVQLREIECPHIRIIEAGNTSNRNLGVAIDVGTTTIVAQLVDMRTGETVGVEASHNRQAHYGEDVISRMIFACGRGGLAALNEAVISTINSLLESLVKEAGVSYDDITCFVAAGNTTMTHLLLDLEPCHIRVEPYIPTANRIPQFQTAELGLHANPKALIHCMPCVSSYVGGDITAGVLASGMHEQPHVSALIDVGTNGEIAVGNNEWLVCCSASAGPAFEGGGIKCGMRASRGAIEKVRLEGESVLYGTIGKGKPIGICGSGLIDIIAELVADRIIDQRGKFIAFDHPRVRVVDEVPEFLIASGSETESGNPVTVTEDDIGNLIKSKGAILAAMKVLLENIGMSFHDLERIYVAGGFGAHLNIERAVFIGLLPDIPVHRIHFIGNSSLAGARTALLSTHAFQKAETISKQMTYFELSVHPEFMKEFVAAMFLPHTQMELFPTVQDALARRRRNG